MLTCSDSGKLLHALMAASNTSVGLFTSRNSANCASERAGSGGQVCCWVQSGDEPLTNTCTHPLASTTTKHTYNTFHTSPQTHICPPALIHARTEHPSNKHARRSQIAQLGMFDSRTLVTRSERSRELVFCLYLRSRHCLQMDGLAQRGTGVKQAGARVKSERRGLVFEVLQDAS